MAALSRRTSNRLRMSLGCLVLVLGGVAMAFTWPAFRALPPPGMTWGWIFLALGAATVLMGGWLLVGRWRGKPLVLSGHPWRLAFFAAMALFYLTTFLVFARPVPGAEGDVGPLVLPGSAASLVGFAACALFVPAGSEAPQRKGPLRVTAARRKKAHQLLALYSAGCVVLIAAGFALGRWVHPQFADSFVPAGIIGLGIAAVLAFRVRRAVPLDEDASAPPPGDGGGDRGH